MNELIDQLNQAFSNDKIPSERDLVVFDGIDELGKEYLREAFLGKSRQEVLGLLRTGRLGNGSSEMEELELAEPEGMRYYLQPFLEYFGDKMRTDINTALDDEFPFFLFFTLGQILKHRGPEVFTKSQLSALRAFVEAMLERAAGLKEGIWLDDVVRSLGEVKRLLADF